MTRTNRCARPSCTQKAQPGRNRGLCHAHYDADPTRGYVDPTPARRRLKLLQDRGVTLDMLTAHGVSRMGVRRVQIAERIRRSTEAKVLAIPVPAGLVVSGADVDGTGTRRRLQALAALGWPQSTLAAELGTTQTGVSAIAQRQWVTAATATAVRELYDRRSMVPGPSAIARRRAIAKGWVPPLAWDEDVLEDPMAVPSTAVGGVVRFADRYRELAELSLPHETIAQRLGIHPRSLSRQIARYGLAS